jgi:hypothetical protein
MEEVTFYDAMLFHGEHHSPSKIQALEDTEENGSQLREELILHRTKEESAIF